MGSEVTASEGDGLGVNVPNGPDQVFRQSVESQMVAAKQSNFSTSAE